MQAIFNIAAIGLAALIGLAGGTGAMVALVELVQGRQGAGATLAGSVLMLMLGWGRCPQRICAECPGKNGCAFQLPRLWATCWWP